MCKNVQKSYCGPCKVNRSKSGRRLQKLYYEKTLVGWTQRVNTFAASIRRRRRPFPTEEEDGRTRVSATPPGERERAHCRLEHTPIVAPSHSVSLKRAQDATLPKWGPTQRREGGEGKGGPLSRTLHLPLPSFPICHYVKWGRVKSCWVDFFRGK